MKIRDWQEAVYLNARAHGWWDGTERGDIRVIPEKIALIHSEASEALECYRDFDKLKKLDALSHIYVTIDLSLYDAGEVSVTRFPIDEEDGDQVRFDTSKPRKPIGFDSELADIVIRVMDLAEHLGIDLERAIQEKHEFNQTRPMRHGGKRI